MQQVFDNPWSHVAVLSSWFLTLVGALPAFVALFGIIYYGIQIYESATVQKKLEKRRMLRKARRIAKIRAEQKVLLAELEALEVVREARVVAEDKVARAANEAATIRAQHSTHEQKADTQAVPGGGEFSSVSAENHVQPRGAGGRATIDGRG